MEAQPPSSLRHSKRSKKCADEAIVETLSAAYGKRSGRSNDRDAEQQDDAAMAAEACSTPACSCSINSNEQSTRREHSGAVAEEYSTAIADCRERPRSLQCDADSEALTQQSAKRSKQSKCRRAAADVGETSLGLLSPVVQSPLSQALSLYDFSDGNMSGTKEAVSPADASPAVSAGPIKFRSAPRMQRGRTQSLEHIISTPKGVCLSLTATVVATTCHGCLPVQTPPTHPPQPVLRQSLAGWHWFGQASV